jgi:hypothetical protein
MLGMKCQAFLLSNNSVCQAVQYLHVFLSCEFSYEQFIIQNSLCVYLQYKIVTDTRLGKRRVLKKISKPWIISNRLNSIIMSIAPSLNTAPKLFVRFSIAVQLSQTCTKWCQTYLYCLGHRSRPGKQV